MKTVFSFLTCGWLCLLSGCTHRPDPHTTVTVRVQSGHGQKLYISRVAYNNEKERVADSAVVEDMIHDIVFVIPEGDERLYRLHFAGSGVSFFFINDVPALSIAGNYLTGKYEIQHSSASVELKRFLDYQRGLTGPARGWACRSFADTVRSSAAFLAVYNSIEFGSDYSAEKKFITAAAARFPSSQPVRDLRDEVLAYIKIMEEEFQPGDLLPAITLPDKDGRSFSTTSLKGKYYLIDFWSTWCPQCLAYNPIKKEMRKRFSPGRLAIVSVAIDAEKEDWQNAIRRQRPDWPQLIDTQMWRGVAVRTLKFDSLPFNFLVDPEGRILRKGLPADSLAGAVISVLERNGQR